MASNTMIYAPVSDGKIQETSSANSLSTQKEKSNNSLDKDAFLSLLVAEMQYQDPLEPTTNTEYISQFATFSQLEATQNLDATNTKQMANDLIGKQVILKVTSTSTGETTYQSGRVDQVYVENGKSYLSVGNELYSIDDLDTVVDEQYLDAVNLSTMIMALIKKLPSSVTLENEASVKAIREAYDELDDYQKGFISSEYVDKLKKAEETIAQLNEANKENTESENDEEVTE